MGSEAYGFVSTSSLGIVGGGSNYLALGLGYLATATSTDSIRAAFFVATSTTGTSTFGGKVSIGSSTPAYILGIQGLKPVIGLNDTTAGGTTWQIRNAAIGTRSFDIFENRSNTTMLGITTNSIGNGQVMIGTSTNSTPGNNSRLFVYGGSNGANIDVMGDQTASGGFGDQANIEAEGSDWGPTGQISSISMRYYGPAMPSGTTMDSPTRGSESLISEQHQQA